MAIQVCCPNPQCGTTASVPEDRLGHSARCKLCGTRFTLTPVAAGASPHPAGPAAASDPALPAQIGRYRIRRKVGSGAFGTVYQAHDTQLYREIALKVLHPEATASRKTVDRFLQEARIVAQMHHPHIVPVFDLGQDGEYFFIASAFIHGRTLASDIPDEGMEPHRAVQLAIQLAEALAYAHSKEVWHRDVKPLNILLDNQDTLYLTDFGLAKWSQHTTNRKTRIGALLGTAGYMSPEQARGEVDHVEAAADLYSAGMVLFEMLTGRVAFEGPQVSVLYNAVHTPAPRPSTFCPGLDLQLDAICLKALAKRPEDRHASGKELAKELQQWLLTAPESPEKRPSSRLRRRAQPTMGDGQMADTSQSGEWDAIVNSLVEESSQPKPEAKPTSKSQDKSRSSRVPPSQPTSSSDAEDEPTWNMPIGGAEGKRAPNRKEKEMVLKAISAPKGSGIAGADLSEGRQTSFPQSFGWELLLLPIPLVIVLVVVCLFLGSMFETFRKNERTAQPTPTIQQGQPIIDTSDDRSNTVWMTSKAGDVSTNSRGMKFAFIPRGSFWMGGGGGTPGREQVTIPHDFFLGVYEVTQKEWQEVMGTNPSYFSRNGGGKDRVKNIPDAELAQFPVENVSWDDIQEFLKKLNAENKDSGWVYRLPTEAEWEYACRGGATSQQECSFHFYFDQPTNNLSSIQANFDGNFPFGNAAKGPYRNRPTRVGSYQPNRLGLHDMHGNVWEWCNDWYTQGSSRVIRGGGWGSNGQICRAADRNGFTPSSRSDVLGLRLARVPSGRK